MTDHLADKLKYLDLVDLAPATPEANTIRAAVSAWPRPSTVCGMANRAEELVEANIIDEQHLLAQLQALRYGDLADYSDELLRTIIVQRAIAELKYRADKRWAGHDETLVASLQSLLPGDRLDGMSDRLRRHVLQAAISLTVDIIKCHRGELRVIDSVWSLGDPEEAENPVDEGSEVPMQVWVSDEQMRAKYRKDFIRYLKAEYDLS